MKGYLAATLVSLTGYNYRLYFFGQTVSIIGTWAQRITQGWLVLELSGSAAALGVTVAVQALPTLLLGPWAGLLADRFDKHRILILTQSILIVPTVALGVITAAAAATIWIVIVAAAITGTIEAFERTARQSFVVEMVGREHLVNAITLNSIALNAGRLVGPALAGVLIVTVGIPPSFFVNAASTCAVIIALLIMRRNLLHRTAPVPRTKGQLIAGFRYVRSRPELLGPLILLTVTGLLAWEWTVTIPLLAREAFDGDAQVVGWMFAAMGAGAIVGALAIAGILRATNRRLIAASLVFAGIYILVGVVPWLAAALVLLFLLGTAGVAYRATTTSLAQLQADPEMRGRTMSFYLMAVGGTSPIGAPLLGWLCDTIGVRATFTIGGVAAAATALVIHLYLRRHGRVLTGAGREPEPLPSAVPTIEEADHAIGDPLPEARGPKDGTGPSSRRA